ncbi:hypothetical protein LTR84_002984 [Exophiala bonariae]|uniref:Uncharacterized protein n=1 Tax=Exophiala bonariae TaxID=1690606 RepID=A0AAV9N9Q5_9EURO|nr:hypothetical protein LTR84_002984 [Exophiala bonariae]
MNYPSKNLEQEALATLLDSVWGLVRPNTDDFDALAKSQAQSYFDHYKDLLYDASLIRKEEITLGKIDEQCQKVAEIVQIVKGNLHRPISEIKAAVIASGQTTWLVRQDDATALSKIVDFAVRLWLFMPLHADKIARKRGDDFTAAMKGLDGTTIQEETKKWMPSPLELRGKLSYDFTIENLVDIAGLSFWPTSVLGDHLMMEHFATTTKIHVFRHATAIEKYKDEDHG